RKANKSFRFVRGSRLAAFFHLRLACSPLAGDDPVTQNDARATPARLTATATIKQPRLFLLGVGLVYIFAALFFRDPWKTDDVAALATMLTALYGPGDHAMLLPQIGSLAYAQDGPLITWVGVFFIKVFSPIFEWFTSPL